MRLFIALDLAADFRRSLHESLAEARDALEGWRWIPAEGWHLTLAFLGEVDRRGADAASTALRIAAGPPSGTPQVVPAFDPARDVAPAPRAADAFGPIEAATGGFIALPASRRASVLAVTIGEGADRVATLARRLEDALAIAGTAAESPFRAPEARSFTAHITVARASSPRRLFTEELPTLPALPIILETMVLYASELRRTGAIHTALSSVPL